MLEAVEVNVLVHPIEYSPPVTEIGLAILIPVIVTGADVTVASKFTPVWSMKLKAVGTASPGSVVLVNEPLTPPTVRIVLVAVPPVEADVWRTHTRALGDNVPEPAVNWVPQPTE
jgi:hypothetical protein